ncbi:glycosyltransferase [Halobium salinum]|uniref:Glycosyltransferase n=1 Tax=Halobium salinum TaxID=1364940 RepID=A0ABD5PAQ4_9EURY|nr:glycosyltransferase family 2 protein [Halobium salinum]
MAVEQATRTPTENAVVDAEPQSELGVSVIIPTYNEVENIEKIVSRCLMALEGHDSEILVVDDDSPDGTARLARESFADNSDVRVIKRTEDKGLAQSVTAGFRHASSESCAVIDADLQHPPEKLPALVDELSDGAAVAIGSRHIEGGGIANWPYHRKVVSKGATGLARLSIPSAKSVSDPMSGFFAVRSDVVEDVELDPKGYKILLEVLEKGSYETGSVAEVPYVFQDRQYGESKLTSSEYKNFVEHLMGLSFSAYGFDRIAEPDRLVRGTEFGFVGAMGAVVNTLVFGGMHLYGGMHYMVAGALAFIVALNFNFLGNWFLTFNQPSEEIRSKYIRFNVVSVGGFIIYSLALATAIDVLLIPALLANVLAIGGSFLFNFIGSEKFAFDIESAN